MHSFLGEPCEMLPGVGLGPLRFRMSRADVEEVLGIPEEVAEYDADIHLYYDRLGVYLFFGEDGGGVLSGIEVDATCNCMLAGKRLFPSSREEVSRFLRSLSKFPDLDAIVVHLEGEGETRITSPELGMDFYFSGDGLLSSVSW